MTEQIQARRAAGVVLPSGEELPNLGLRVPGPPPGTGSRGQDVTGLRTGLDLGLTVIDTAPGHAEELVAEAIRGRRENTFLIGRLATGQASPRRTVRDALLASCQESLRRLDTDRIDLCLLHRWRMVPLAELVEAVNMLMTEGLVRHWGVQDFDIPDLVELTAVPGGTAVEANQVHYDLAHREIEWDLLPRCRAARLPTLARVTPEPSEPPGPATGPDAHPTLTEVARRHGVGPGQIGLAWVVRQGGVYALVAAAAPEQIRRYHRALELSLTEEDLADLDAAFPPPAGPPRPPGTAA